MNPILDKCPVCSGRMIITSQKCVECGTKVVGEFKQESQQFDLPQDIINFIKVFIYAEGSIKQSEKMLNCSYPKIKNLLKKAKEALGVSDTADNVKSSVIDQLEKGEISVEEALNQLKKD